jgi:predicted metal-dependent HD superfamily phosphohydrolase
MIKQAYIAQVVQCGVSLSKAEELWLQIEKAYTEEGRFYHDLSHLDHLLAEMQPLRFNDWPTVFFANVYHDVVYDVEQHMVTNDNEERSAEFAESHLKLIKLMPDKIEKCKELILATKEHRSSRDNDTNLFTDADLCILGQAKKIYNEYKNNVRIEFAVYPDAIFYAGRRKILANFLQMEPLFKTLHFRNRYAERAKENIRRELQLLQV